MKRTTYIPHYFVNAMVLFPMLHLTLAYVCICMNANGLQKLYADVSVSYKEVALQAYITAHIDSLILRRYRNYMKLVSDGTKTFC